MKQLNYNHLQYFYTVVSEGGIHRAAQKLHVTPQTVSGQIAQLERYLGYPLFDRSVKRLVPTRLGKEAAKYAATIFQEGDKLSRLLDKGELDINLTFQVGVLDSIPKIFAYDLLRQCFMLEQKVQLKLHTRELESLLGEFALNKLDLIISDRPIPPEMSIKGYSHAIAESGFSFYVAEFNHKVHPEHFPQCMDKAPMLLPGDNSMQKNMVLSWLNEKELSPLIMGEFEDTGLMKLFGQEGHGIFFSPTMIEPFVLEQYQVQLLGRTNEIKETFYAITPERKVMHPAAVKIIEEAKRLSSNAHLMS